MLKQSNILAIYLSTENKYTWIVIYLITAYNRSV